MSTQHNGGRDDFERIRPLPVAPAGAGDAAEAPPRAGREPGWKRWLGWLLLGGLLLLLLLGVFLWLPQRVAAPPTPAPTPPPSAAERDAASGDPAQGDTAGDSSGRARPAPAAGATDAATDAATAPEDLEQMLEKRQRARELAEAGQAAVDALAERQPDSWAAEAWLALQAQAQAARKAFGRRDYDAAIAAWQALLDAAEGLQQRAEALLAQALQRGKEALEAGQQAPAVAAFERALRLDPGNAEAERGLRRAQSLDALRAALNRGAEAESRGDLAAAGEAYRQAREIDGASQRARDGLARVQAAMAKQAFAAAMSRGLQALDRQDFGAAESAFREALRHRPGAPEAQDGLARARAGITTQRIAELRQRAARLEAEERWSDAAAAYQALLEIDPSLAVAQAGRERSEMRAALDGRLQAHLQRRERLSAESVREDAAGVLAQAQAVEDPGPRLQRQVAELEEALRVASTPLPVVLRSDGRTEVTLYRVGELGRFERRELELRPGNYTVVGRCPGYRDVMHRFTVAPGGDNAPPPIRCEEKI